MIITFGSINLDVVVRVETLPRPGETIKGQSYDLIAGGKGANQAVACARAGANVKMIGATGDDTFALPALEVLKNSAVDLSELMQSKKSTGMAMIAVEASGENHIVLAEGANGDVNFEQLKAIEINQNDILLTQQEVDNNETWKAIEYVKSKGAISIHNAAPAKEIPENILKQIDYLIVNETEAIIVADALSISTTDPIKAITKLSKKYNITCIATLGGEGAVAFQNEKKITAQSLQIKPVDTTGAGDAFMGAFAAEISRGSSIKYALQFGCAAGSLACTIFGAQTSSPQRKTIEESLERITYL